MLDDDTDGSSVVRRELDLKFYHDLYHPDKPTLGEEWLKVDWGNHPGRYCSAKDAAARNGFTTTDWVQLFDTQSYIVFNTLTEEISTDAQAIVHFVEIGWRAGLPMSGDHLFDPASFEEFCRSRFNVDSLHLYKLWIEHGFLAGAPPNERARLRQLEVSLASYPAEFDWKSYQVLNPGLPGADRWSSLEHYLEHGCLESPPPLSGEASSTNLLLAAADRFVEARREAEAMQVYDRLTFNTDLSCRAIQHSADQHMRAGQSAAALLLYQRVRTAGEATNWTWINGASCASKLGAVDLAEEWILAGLKALPRNTKLRNAHRDWIRMRHDRAVASYLGQLQEPGATTALKASLDGLFDSLINASYVQFGSMERERRPPDGRAKGITVVMLANQDLPQCTFYRITQKAEQLAGGPISLFVIDKDDADAFVSRLATADLAILYRVASNPDVLRCIAACRVLAVPVIYDIDDLVFDPKHFPDSYDSYAGMIDADGYRGLQAGVPLVRHALMLCDFGLASTEALAEQMRPLVRTGQVAVHRNSLSRQLEGIARNSSALPLRSHVTLFYGTGTKAHGSDFQHLIEPILVRLMAEQPTVRFVACGHLDVEALKVRYPTRVQHIDLLTSRDAYLSLLQNADINLSVLTKTTFNDCKSEIKWLEAAAFCIPSVVSDVRGLVEPLRPGEDVVVCSPEPADWYAKLRALVSDHSMRARIGASARDRALAQSAPAETGRSLASQLARFAAHGIAVPATGRTGRRRPRVLVVNVFYPPQSIGGATRVVADLVDSVLTEYRDRFEVGVLCGNDESTAEYDVEAYDWKGVPVWSIATPHHEHMDWRPEDPEIAQAVDAVLDQFEPDLVHLHCIQRLTLTTLDRIQRRQIPTIVSVHDAWWISDHQFLVDDLCRLRMPWDLVPFGTLANPHSAEQSGARRMAMRAALGRANTVLAVSDSFADTYRKAGITQTEVLENGVPVLPPLEPTIAAPGKIRIGHVGGAVHHKGFFLLKQALMQGAYEQIEVVATDHTLSPGEQLSEMWGRSKATILSRQPQSRVGWLYGQFDILAAPSIWPESFGLVTREALHYGKWVIASDRGAIGAAILSGRNGWVIDVSNRLGMQTVLDEISATPEMFLRAPQLISAHRTVADMVRDTVAVWSRTLEVENARVPNSPMHSLVAQR